MRLTTQETRDIPVPSAHTRIRLGGDDMQLNWEMGVGRREARTYSVQERNGRFAIMRDHVDPIGYADDRETCERWILEHDGRLLVRSRGGYLRAWLAVRLLALAQRVDEETTARAMSGSVAVAQRRRRS